MKGIRGILLPWTIIFAFLAIVFTAFNQQQSTDHNREAGKEPSLPDSLHPVVEEKKDILLERSREKGIRVVITDTVRSIEEQNQLYEQGRSDNGNIVTNARGGESYHNYGLAIDYALADESGNLLWDIHYDGNENGKSDWREVAAIAKELGFTWGGDWQRFPDYPHLQMEFGLSIRELQNGERPEIDKNGQ
ncbi:M15 family metallopeptidase [Virgibacillus xinjiangensis]|uniref:M15 family metallopeptidase n=1 Tax=Virgibacillus xinjiangensis TaxID=393090 RepID=A0ABV7CSL3_9BACI